MKINTVYVENDIKNNTNTLKILQRIEFNEIIYCNKHTEIFNPKNQNFRIQKLQPSLILAKKHKNFILKVPKNFSIGFKKNYYFSHMLNCLYDCSYCFLQGMFYSANYLIYVNYEDFFYEIEKHASKKIDTCFFSGYDCDSLVLENVTTFIKIFLNFFKNLDNAFLEIRTKSTNIEVLKKTPPLKNVIVAYSLNPETIISDFEKKTPNLKRRLESLKALQGLGWKIGLRFDPLIDFMKNIKIYQNFFKDVFEVLDANNIHSVTVGSFRMPNKFLERIINLRPMDSLIFNKLNCENKENVNKIRHLCQKELSNFISNKKLFFN